MFRFRHERGAGKHQPAPAKLDSLLATSVGALKLIVFDVTKGHPPAEHRDIHERASARERERAHATERASERAEKRGGRERERIV